MTAMTNTPRVADHPVDRMFIDRSSPRAFTDEPIAEAELLIPLEAARWAPSAANHQPARLVWGRRGDATFKEILAALNPANQVWADKAAALVLVGSITQIERDGALVPLTTHAFDAGAAWMSLALQAHLRGWVAHAMGGFDKARAAAAFDMGEGFQLHAVVAIGRHGDVSLLPESYRPREVPSGRKPLSQIARNGRA